VIGNFGGHLRHHWRFYLGALAGLVAGTAASLLSQPLPFVVGGDAFFVVYLVLMAWQAKGLTPAAMRRRATFEDEGMKLIALITGAAIVLSLGSLFLALRREDGPGALTLGLALASVPLGWLTLHTVAAFRYGHVYYARADADGGKRREAGGLAFPRTDEPGCWDFLYHSFVIGMTAQVSDVQVLTARMRRLVLAHSIAAFFYNTVLLALAVNVAVGWG
jgi:uncharacterized membrane protein